MKRSLHAALPSLDTLIVFEHAAAELSFTKAGAHLGLTQSAVSRQILDLEALLGVELFSRQKRAVSLTPAGTEFRELVRPSVQGLQEAVLAMRMRMTPSNVVNISVAASFCNLWFIPNLPRYYQEAVGAQINVVPHVGQVSFKNRGSDAAVVSSIGPPPNCCSMKLIDLALIPYASAALMKKLGVQRFEDFDTIPALQLIESSGLWSQYFAHVGWPQSRVNYPGTNGLHLLNYEAAVAGLGVALLPPEFVMPGEQHSGLLPLHDALLAITRSYYYCWPEGSEKKDAVASLGIWLRREIHLARERRSRLPG